MASRTLAASVAPSPRAASGEIVRAGPGAARRVAELDGIRAIAIWLVLLIHALATASATRAAASFHGWQAALWQVVAHGWLGVDLFFVLSGFLITGILLDANVRPNYFGNFYLRRALRILPVLLVVLSVMALIYRGPAAYFGLALLFCANVAGLLGVATPPGLGPLWSLAVEEQFYLFWPGLVRVCSVQRLALLATAIVVAEPLIRLAFWTPEAQFYTWMRCDGLALGALVAIWVRNRRSQPSVSLRLALGWVVLAVALGIVELLVRSSVLSSSLRTSEADLVFAAAILSAYTLRGSRWTAPLRSAPAAFFAATSYCAYVVHAPLFNLIDGLGLTRSDSPFVAGALRGLYGYPLVFGIAALSRRFLEEPFLRLKGVLTRA